MLFQIVVLACEAAVVLSSIKFPIPIDVCHTAQFTKPAEPRVFTIIILGATPNPCPIVSFVEAFFVNVATLKPAVAFALTCAEIVPLVLVTVEPPAFHCQPT